MLIRLSLSRSSSLTNPIVRTYVLPDFLPDSLNQLGFVRPLPTGNTPPPISPPTDEDAIVVDGTPGPSGHAHSKKQAQKEEEQLLQMNNERFTVPEILFNPSTIGAFLPPVPTVVVEWSGADTRAPNRPQSRRHPRDDRPLYRCLARRVARHVLGQHCLRRWE